MKPKRLILCIMTLWGCGMPLLAQYTADDWKERDQWMDVSKIFELAQIEEGMQVADIGCHEGYLTLHLSKRVADQGKVYAVDVEDYRLDALKGHLQKAGRQNVEVVLGAYDDPRLPSEQLDAAILMDTYHEIDEYLTVLRHIKKALKPKGRLLVLEKLKTYTIGKSREEQVRAHTLSSDYVEKELQQVGLTIIETVDYFGDWQENKEKRMWILVAQKD